MLPWQINKILVVLLSVNLLLFNILFWFTVRFYFLLVHAVEVEETECSFLEIFTAQVMCVPRQIELFKILAMLDQF